MADIGGLVGGLGGAVDSLFGGIGQLKAAKGYQRSAEFSRISAGIAEQQTRIQQLQADRDIYRTIGGARADIGGAGLAMSGGALDVIRDSTQQGALTKQLIAAQGAITVSGYQAEAASYESMAAAAKSAGKGGIFGGILKAVGTVATFAALSDDRMKEDITLVERRRDGLGIYDWRYKGQPTMFRGVLASEVERLYPRAVQYINGLAHVDYGMIGVTPEVAV